MSAAMELRIAELTEALENARIERDTAIRFSDELQVTRERSALTTISEIASNAAAGGTAATVETVLSEFSLWVERREADTKSKVALNAYYDALAALEDIISGAQMSTMADAQRIGAIA